MEDLNTMTADKKYIAEIKWQKKSIKLNEVLDDELLINPNGSFVTKNGERLSAAFYNSSYVCPDCGKHLYKANVGERMFLCFGSGHQPMRSIFLCNSCHVMYAPLRGKKLGEGEAFVLKDPHDVADTCIAIDKYGMSLEELQSGMFF